MSDVDVLTAGVRQASDGADRGVSGVWGGGAAAARGGRWSHWSPHPKH